MFRATICPSSGEITLSMRHLVLVTLCRWLFGQNNKYQVSYRYCYFTWWWAHSRRNMYRKEINILRKVVHRVGFIYKFTEGCTVNKTKYSSSFMEIQVHYRVQNSLAEYHGLIQCHQFHTLQTNIFQISFNITLAAISWFIPLGFQTMNFHARHKSRSSRHPRFTHFNIIWRLYMTNFLLFNFI